MTTRTRILSPSDVKTCFKCSTTKPLSEFYTHPQMADGHLNKCKACACADTADRLRRKALDPVWLESEYERHRLKQRRARANGTAYIPTPEKKRLIEQRYYEKYPERKRAHRAVNNALRNGRLKRKPCEVCASVHSEAHHDDYSRPLDVKWLCPAHHHARHVELRRLARLCPQPITTPPQ